MEGDQEAAITLGLMIGAVLFAAFFIWRVRVQARRRRAPTGKKRVVVKATPKQVKKLIETANDPEAQNRVGNEILFGDLREQARKAQVRKDDKNRKKRERKARRKGRRK